MDDGSRGADHGVGARPWPTIISDTSLPEARRRTMDAIAKRLSRLLAPGEAVLDFSEAVEDASRLSRAVLGAAWAPSHRVALVFTPRRLLEIGLDATGRRALGRIRSFPWDRIAAFVFRDEWLEIRSWDEGLHRWYLRDLPDPSLQVRIQRQVDLAVSSYGPAAARDPVAHCSQCGARMHAGDRTCGRCAAVGRRRGRAARLAVAVPGGGHLYAGRPVAAALHFGLELVVFALLASLVLVTTDVWRVAAAVGVGFVLLALMKLQSVASARRMADRAGTISRTGDLLSRWAQPVGLLLSIAVLVAPLLSVGALERTISWDLHVAASDGSWSLTATETMEGESSPLRSRWRQRDGALAELRAQPFEAFESAAAVRERLVKEHGALVESGHLGTLLTTVEGPADRPISRATVFIVDSAGRDLHSVSTEDDDPKRAEARLRDLVRRAYWTRADPPD
jgi:hypothetical protein